MTETKPICAICSSPLGVRWTDTHGVGVCTTCGLPYRIYHYENDERVDRPPSIEVNERWLPLAKEYLDTLKQRVFPGACDMGILRHRGGRTYSGATEEQMREFDEWLEARKDRWPVGEPRTEDAVDPVGESATG